jgi:hypothetical protein
VIYVGQIKGRRVRTSPSHYLITPSISPSPSPPVARLADKVTAMSIPERAARVAEWIDTQIDTEEDNLEFTKLMCLPDTYGQDVLYLIA